MNWTGGSLARSRKQNANLTVIQKKHFAKVRGQLLKARPPPPRLDVAIFQDARHDGGAPISTVPASDRRRERQKSQMTLDEFENVRPVVKQLQTLRPRQAQAIMQPQSSESQRPRQFPEFDPRLSARVKQESSHVSARGQDQETKATSPVFKSIEIPPTMDELETKRRELLGTSDWMGLKKLKPLKMHFPNAEDRDLIGKRRLVKSDHSRAVRVLPTPTQHRKPVINAYEKLNRLRASSNPLSSASKISIHIGSSDTGLSARPREEPDCEIRDHRPARPSEEMLFDSEVSAGGSIRNQAPAQVSFHQSRSASDEMLLDREWSGIASPFDTEPTATKKDSHQQSPEPSDQPSGIDTHPQAAYTISSEPESVYSDESKYAVGGSHDHRDERVMATETTALTHTGLVTIVRRPFAIELEAQASGERIDLLHIQDSSPSQTTFDREGDQFIDHTPPERTGRSLHQDDLAATERPSNQLPTAHPGLRKQGQPFTQATARDLTSLLNPVDSSKEASPEGEVDREPHEDNGFIGSGDVNEIGIDARNVEEQEVHLTELPQQQHTLKSAIRDSLPNEHSSAPATTKAPTKSPSPSPRLKSTTSIPQPQAGPQEPADPNPEDDELIWRNFVFGTEKPDDDWIFDKPDKSSKGLPKSHLPDASSSPLLTINFTSDRDKQSSPIPQTQPSLLVEASSSSLSAAPNFSGTLPSQSSSPAHAQPLPSTIAEPASTASHDEQASMLANPSITTSSDELALSPARPIRPSVVFRRPRRYVGESSSPVAPIGLGVDGGKQRKGRRKRMRGDRDEDDGTYGERGRRKRRGEWRVEVQEAIDEEEEGGDEIVDD